MSSGPFDIVVGDLSIRYKVYKEKKRKDKVKYCVGFDPASPTPERDWDQTRADGNPEEAVRAAVQSASDTRESKRARTLLGELESDFGTAWQLPQPPQQQQPPPEPPPPQQQRMPLQKSRELPPLQPSTAAAWVTRPLLPAVRVGRMLFDRHTEPPGQVLTYRVTLDGCLCDADADGPELRDISFTVPPGAQPGQTLYAELPPVWSNAPTPPQLPPWAFGHQCSICTRRDPSSRFQDPYDSDVRVIRCWTCPHIAMCDSACINRRPCPSHLAGIANWHTASAREYRTALYQIYAEVAAGRGCPCSCCQSLITVAFEPDVFDDELCYYVPAAHAVARKACWGDEAPEVERAALRQALAAAGNPPCYLRDRLEECDACRGDCGMVLWCSACRAREADQECPQNA